MQHEDFWPAILADPSDTPRLIYADWLEEQGDPRSEFIRVQCELAHLTDDDPRWPALKARETAMLEEYAEEWKRPLRRLVRDGSFRRGFMEEVTMEAAVFLRRAEDLYRLAPVRYLRVLDGGRLIPQLAASPFLARLSSLQLNANYVGDAGALALAETPHVAGLTFLHLGHNNLGDRAAEFLAMSERLSSLARLDLSYNRITVRGARALARAKNLAALCDVSLRENQIPWDDWPAVREEFGARYCQL
jgi:uncharacterized protein (TIGR02996 family)